MFSHMAVSYSKYFLSVVLEAVTMTLAFIRFNAFVCLDHNKIGDKDIPFLLFTKKIAVCTCAGKRQYKRIIFYFVD